MEQEPVTDVEVKKKRGRRPKSEKLVVVESDKSIITPNNDKEIDKDSEISSAIVDTPAKSKRGRKPKYVYNAFDVNGVSTNANSSTSLSDDENVIVKLKITPGKEEDDLTGNSVCDDNAPYAYNRDVYSNISGANIMGDNEISTIMEEPQNNNNNLKVLELLKDFEEKNKNNEWPSNTSIACYWCCHKFENAPYGIPINYKDGKFEVFGCFCSLECATSYNFKQNENIDEMWERYNLINLMCRKMNYGDYIKPAPDRLSLKMFGGFLEIEKFREYFKTNKVINVNFPPMTSIIQQLEEINEYELNSDMKYIPIDNDRINKYKEKILFKRSKPLINPKTSLESSMNLKYH